MADQEDRENPMLWPASAWGTWLNGYERGVESGTADGHDLVTSRDEAALRGAIGQANGWTVDRPVESSAAADEAAWRQHMAARGTNRTGPEIVADAHRSWGLDPIEQDAPARDRQYERSA